MVLPCSLRFEPGIRPFVLVDPIALLRLNAPADGQISGRPAGFRAWLSRDLPRTALLHRDFDQVTAAGWGPPPCKAACCLGAAGDGDFEPTSAS
jgi:hypothetical protein